MASSSSFMKNVNYWSFAAHLFAVGCLIVLFMTSYGTHNPAFLLAIPFFILGSGIALINVIYGIVKEKKLDESCKMHVLRSYLLLFWPVVGLAILMFLLQLKEELWKIFS